MIDSLPFLKQLQYLFVILLRGSGTHSTLSLQCSMKKSKWIIRTSLTPLWSKQIFSVGLRLVSEGLPNRAYQP